MNANRFFEAKNALYEELGNAYPTSREELSFSFLLSFANYLPGPDEEDYEDYREYENDKYNSEQWTFICKLTEATTAVVHDSEAGKTAWEEYLDWVTDNYFPEFVIFNPEHPGIIHAHTEDLPFFDKSKETVVYNEKMEGMEGLVMIGDAISVMMFSEGPADYTLDASWYLDSFENLMLLSYNLNNYVDDNGNGWTVRNGELYYAR